MTELFDSWGIPLNTKVYFTFTYDGREYVYLDLLDPDGDEPERECRALGWDLFRGTHIKSSQLPDGAREFCQTIISRAESEPDKYPLNAEHYTATSKSGRKGSGEESDRSRLRVTKSSKSKLFDAKHTSSVFVFKWLIVLAVALAYGFLTMSNLGWGRILFPEGTGDTVIKVFYIALQLAGSSYFYLVFKPYRWAAPMVIMGVMPMVCCAALITFAVNTAIRWVVLIGLALFALGYIFPQISRLINSDTACKKAKILNDIRLYTTCALIVAVTGGLLGGVFAGVDGFVYTDPAKTEETVGEGSENETRSSYDLKEVEKEYAKALKTIDAEVWSGLGAEEKIQALQSIIDYESGVVLGISPITLKVSAMEEYIAGRYSDQERAVIISESYLESYNAESIIKVVLHETRHAWQFAMVHTYRDLLPELDDKQLSLNIFRDAKEYESNLLSYNKYDGTEETYDDYNNQPIEVDSDEWAEKVFAERYAMHVLADNRE